MIYISAPSQQYAEQIREHILTKPETVVVEEKLGKGMTRKPFIKDAGKTPKRTHYRIQDAFDTLNAVNV